jgi:hypothetical protein
VYDGVNPAAVLDDSVLMRSSAVDCYDEGVGCQEVVVVAVVAVVLNGTIARVFVGFCWTTMRIGAVSVVVVVPKVRMR